MLLLRCFHRTMYGSVEKNGSAIVMLSALMNRNGCAMVVEKEDKLWMDFMVMLFKIYASGSAGTK